MDQVFDNLIWNWSERKKKKEILSHLLTGMTLRMRQKSILTPDQLAISIKVTKIIKLVPYNEKTNSIKKMRETKLTLLLWPLLAPPWLKLSVSI